MSKLGMQPIQGKRLRVFPKDGDTPLNDTDILDPEKKYEYGTTSDVQYSFKLLDDPRNITKVIGYLGIPVLVMKGLLRAALANPTVKSPKVEIYTSNDTLLKDDDKLTPTVEYYYKTDPSQVTIKYNTERRGTRTIQVRPGATVTECVNTIKSRWNKAHQTDVVYTLDVKDETTGKYTPLFSEATVDPRKEYKLRPSHYYLSRNPTLDPSDLIREGSLTVT